MTPIHTHSRILVLQHPRESKVAINTARLAQLGLPSLRLEVGTRWGEDDLERWTRWAGSNNVALLYPAPGAQDVSRLATHPRPLIIVLDGTWSQARSMLRDSPVLGQLAAYSFRPSRPSRYLVRREPDPSYLSTIESLAHVLRIIEGDETLPERLLRPFHAMVRFQIECAATRHTPRVSRKARRGPRRPGLDPRWLAAPSRIVCLEGTANLVTGPDGRVVSRQLLHLAASRPQDGRTLHVLSAPRGGVDEGSARYARLDAPLLALSVPPEAAREQWSRFFGPDDVLCTWGYHAVDLLRESGLWRGGEHIDLRAVVKNWTRKRWRSVLLACRGVTGAGCQRHGPGLAGVRLGAMLRLWQALVAAERL